MGDLMWERYPLSSQVATAREWLLLQVNLQRAPATVAAYARGLEGYLAFCRDAGVGVEQAGAAAIGAYVRFLADRAQAHTATGVANATLQLKLTVIRLYYSYLVEEGIRATNPVGRGSFSHGEAGVGGRTRGLVPRLQSLPWIPNDTEYGAILTAACQESLRNRYMLMLAYHCALRREELCGLAMADISLEPRGVRVRAAVTKGRRERFVPFTDVIDPFYAAYLRQRRTLSRETGALFLSESRRNYAQPITIWTWSKVVAQLAARAGVPQFSTHTLRHLRLTDLARSGWDLHEIALFAGHRSTQTTLRYIHRSGRELAASLARTMDDIHAWRSAVTAEVLAR